MRSIVMGINYNNSTWTSNSQNELNRNCFIEHINDDDDDDDDDDHDDHDDGKNKLLTTSLVNYTWLSGISLRPSRSSSSPQTGSTTISLLSHRSLLSRETKWPRTPSISRHARLSHLTYAARISRVSSSSRLAGRSRRSSATWNHITWKQFAILGSSNGMSLLNAFPV